jgi:DNA-binding MarR family transcriptional regulator
MVGHNMVGFEQAQLGTWPTGGMAEMLPFVSVISQCGDQMQMMRQAVEAAGAEVYRAMSLSDAMTHLEDRRPTGTVVMDISDASVPLVPLVLSAVSKSAARDGHGVIISSPIECLDQLAGEGLEPHVTWLCQPAFADRVAAISLGVGLERSTLMDVSSDMDPQRLRRLADEVSRIARTLASLSGPRPSDGFAVASVADHALAFHAQDNDLGELKMPEADELRRIIRLRRLRDSFFDPALFADPAWDMLLDLMAARIERAQVAVSSLCIAAAVPPTTALRWIKTMTDHGIFERCADPDDGRRIFIRLADHAVQAMARYFAAARRAGGAII